LILLQVKLQMKIIFFLFSVFFSLSLSSQEYWDPTDFEISNNEIRPSLSDLSFGLNSPSNFSLPSGNIINPPLQKKQIDMMAIIEEENSHHQRKIDLKSPIPQKKKKKAFEITGEARAYDDNDLYNSPFNSHPYYRGFGNPSYRGLNRFPSYGSPFYSRGRIYY